MEEEWELKKKRVVVVVEFSSLLTACGAQARETLGGHWRGRIGGENPSEPIVRTATEGKAQPG